MKQYILLAFIGAFLTMDTTSFKINEYPSNLAWLFGINDKLNKTRMETRAVCQTEECKKIAKVIIESMDKSVDPCHNFYEYACGKWPKNNPIPKGMSKWSLWKMLQKKIEQQIQDILKTGLKDSDLLAVKLAKKWYIACTDIDAMEKRGLEPLVSTLSRLGGWPIIMEHDEWDEQEYSWQKVDDQYVRLTGKNAFHDVRIYGYGSNETEKIVHIDTPHLPPGAYNLWSGDAYSSVEVESESNEDPSDEEKQSDEGKNSQEPGSEDKDGEEDSDKTTEKKEEGNDDDDSNTNEYNNERDIKKELSRKKLNKFARRKNKDSSHNTKRRKTGTQVSQRHDPHKKVKRSTRRQTMKTKADSKTSQYFTHRERLNTRKHIRNYVRKEDGKGKKKILDNVDEMYTSTTSQTNTEETSDEVDIRQRYVDYISKVVRAIAKERGSKISDEQFSKDIENMIEFQLKLTEIVMESGQDLEITLDNFQAWYSGKKPKTANGRINWVYKITELFDEANVLVDSDLNIEVGSPDYFEALVSLLDETPGRTIVNYIHWNFLSRIIKTTTSNMREMYDAWEEIKEEDRKPRSSTCIREVEMSDILAYEYVSKYFSDDIAQTAMDMIDDIQKEVEYQIKKSEWMDDDTKDFVLAKLVNMKKLVGYPEWYKNNTIVKRYFQGLVIDTSYYENSLSYGRYIRWKRLRKLMEDDTIETWWINPLTVNAFFAPEENSITITAVDFQSPFFSYSRPQTINFGIIGFVMAHEVNHGFDDTGHLYDKNGDFMEWLSTMAQAYGERAECFVEQFNNYPVDKATNTKVKNYGNQTADENIADTMGLQAVFKAYHRRERECGKLDAALPGLEEFTNDQLFFLSFANLWCEAFDPTSIIKSAKIDEHSTARLRVMGSVSNSEDFAKAYNCPSGSPMNPEKKCNIWK